MRNAIVGLLLFGTVVASAAENYSSWGSFRNIVVDTRNQAGGARVATDQVNFPVLVRLNASQADVFSGSAVAGGGDIRFGKGTTHLAYQRERWDAANNLAEFWVLVPLVKGGDTTQIQIYWNKSGVADSSSGTAVFNSGNSFRAVWHMSESASPSLDATPNGLSATWNNGPATIDGLVGKGVNFANGTGATGINGKFMTAANVAGGLDMNGTSGVTLSFWMRRTGTNSGGTSVQMMAGRYNYSSLQMQFGLVTNAGGAIILYYAPNGDGDMTLASGTTVTANTWYHVTASLTANSQVVYVNGVQRAASATAMTSLDQVYSDPFTMGVMDFTAPYSQYFNGALDEIQYSAKARPADWVKLTYQTQRTDTSCVTVGSTVLLPPIGFSYAPNPAVYTVGYAIPNNNPIITGNVTGYSVSPALPAGLTLNTTTGVISGTPTAAAAAADYTVTASNSGGSATVLLNITVNAALAVPSGLSYAPNPAFYGVNAPIASNVPVVTGTVTAYSVAPALPAGLTLNTTTGVISGTPTAVSAAASYTVTAGNSAGSTTASVSITVLAAPSALSYSSPTANYPRNLAITPNNPVVTGTVTGYSITPALPTGLSLNPGTGVITGTPTTVTAARAYTVTASNAAGSTQGTVNISVYGAPTGLYYSANPNAYLPNQPITPNNPTLVGTATHYSVTPPLPTGLILDSVTGAISGTPTVPNGAYVTYTVTASNVAGSTTVDLFIWIQGASAISSSPSSSFMFRISGASPVSFHVPENAKQIRLEVLDVWGRSVWSCTVEPGRMSGTREILWDGLSSGGAPVASGVYMLRMSITGPNPGSSGIVERKFTFSP